MDHLHSNSRDYHIHQSPRTRRTGNASRFAGKLIRRAFFISLLGLVFVLALGSAAQAAPPQPAIWTDKADYHPGEIVTIYGVEFRQNKTVDVSVTRPDASVDTWTTLADINGSFVTTYQLNGIVGNYTVEATDGRRTATTTFTDAVQVDWVQCRNDNNNDEALDSPLCTWSTGSINAQKALQTEGNNVPNNAPGSIVGPPADFAPTGTYTTTIPGHVNYRAIFEGLTPGTYVLTIKYEFTKGGKFAFDFLTTNFGVTDNNLCDSLPSGPTPAQCSSLVGSGPATAPFPLESEPVDLIPYGGGSVSARQGTHNTVFSGFSPSTMKVYGASTVAVAQVLHTGSVTGNSEDRVKVTFVVPTPVPDFIMATWGGHFAIGLPDPTVGYGLGNGAGSISGAPFHMTLDGLERITPNPDPSVISGGRDRSVNPGAVVLGKIIINKVAVPADGTDFSFTGDQGIGPFTLDDDAGADSEFPNTMPFDIGAGTFIIFESVPAGWTITLIDCTFTTSTVEIGFWDGTAFTIPVGTTAANFEPGDNAVKITLVPADEVSCTFTNTGLGMIEWEKRVSTVATPHPYPTTAASFTVGGASGPFACLGDTTNPITVVDNGLNDADATLGRLKLIDVCAGTYTIIETASPVGTALDADLDRVVIVAAGASVVIGTQTVDDDGAEEDFHNGLGSITIKKVTEGDDGTFSFAGTGPFGGVSALGGSITTDGFVGLTTLSALDLFGGVYTVEETSFPAEWALTAVVCELADLTTLGTVNLGAGTVTFTLPAGGDVTCTFTNTKLDAFITIGSDDTNGITEPHAFIVHVEVDDGSGFQAAVGVFPSISFTGGTPGYVDTSDCDDGTDANGNCVVIINSNVAGTFTAHATVTVTVVTAAGNVDLTRSTDGDDPNSGDAIKEYVAGSLRWTKVDESLGLLGGATFEVCLLEVYQTFTDTFVDVADVCFDVTDNDALDQDPDNGEFELTGLVLGKYTVQETVAPPGFVLDPDLVEVQVTLDPLEVVIPDPFVNEAPFESCTPGFWKNHPDFWPSAYSTDDPFNDVFGQGILDFSDYSGLDDETLREALEVSGGELMALNRHAVAALLNADSLPYPLTVAEVIDLYQDGVGAVAGPETISSAHGILASHNEDFECTLGGEPADPLGPLLTAISSSLSSVSQNPVSWILGLLLSALAGILIAYRRRRH